MSRNMVREKIRTLAPVRLRRAILRTRVAARYPSQAARSLPDFLIIGTQRGGTTSLFHYLSQHPFVIRSLRKEVQYFSRRYEDGERWYRSHFPLEARKRALSALRKSPVLTFEATPDYVFYPGAAQRAARLVPKAKLVVLLRNPITRAYSHYRHMCRLGFEDLSFEEALEREDERLAPDREAIRRDPLYPARQYLRYSYAKRGLYLEQLLSWLSVYPRERLLVLRSEDFFRDPKGVYQTVLDFLELPRYELTDVMNHSHRGRGGESGDRLDPKTRSALAERFREPNRQLTDFLDMDLGWHDGE